MKINQIPKAMINPGQGLFILKAAKNPNVAMIQLIKNLIIVVMLL